MDGFIITRHVNSEKTNSYWNECYNCIRKNYPTTTIMIIDDNSNYEYVKLENTTVELTNVFFVQSEYPGRGELLPYYYMYKYKLFKKAVIIHDSIFIQNKNIDLLQYDKEDKYPIIFLWDFEHKWELKPDIRNDIKNLIEILNKKKSFMGLDLLDIYENKKDKWTGCFGGMSIIKLDYLESLEKKYNLFVLLDHVDSRVKRCCFERVFGLLCNLDKSLLMPKIPILFGNIHKYINQYCKWKYEYEKYLNDKQINNKILSIYPLIKVHSGR